MSEEFLVTKVDQVVMSSIDHLLSPNEDRLNLSVPDENEVLCG
jgi:hypothetical protein